MDLNKYVCELRKKKRLSKKKFAEKLSVKESLVEKWENGTAKLTVNDVEKISESFNIDINELINSKELIGTINKSKRINVIISIVMCSLLIIVFVVSYLFIESMKYKSISIYSFSGSSENFQFNNGLVVLSRDNKYIELSDFKIKNKLNIKSMTINVAFNESIWAIKEYDSLEYENVNKWLKNVEFSEYDKEGFVFGNKDKSDSFSKYVTKFPYDFKVEINYCTQDDCNVEILDITTEKLNTKSKIKK